MQLSGIKSFFQTCLPFLLAAPQALAEGEPKFLLPDTLDVYAGFYEVAVQSSINATQRAQAISHDIRTALSEKPVPHSDHIAAHAYVRDTSEMDDDACRLAGIAVALMRQSRFVPEDFDFRHEDIGRLSTAREYAEREARQWEWKKIWKWGTVIFTTRPDPNRLHRDRGPRLVVKFRDKYYVMQLRMKGGDTVGVLWATESVDSMNLEELRMIVRDTQK